jgi:hypothetical protein
VGQGAQHAAPTQIQTNSPHALFANSWTQVHLKPPCTLTPGTGHIALLATSQTPANLNSSTSKLQTANPGSHYQHPINGHFQGHHQQAASHQDLQPTCYPTVGGAYRLHVVKRAIPKLSPQVPLTALLTDWLHEVE